VAAIVALVHDVLITLGAFSLAGHEISLAVIAAFLTIVGYSLNDTIVVFDRIRENLRVPAGRGYMEMLNRSINQSLSRTIITSSTTIVVVVILLLFGGEVLRDFSFALTVGVVVGTYSSVFVATPLLAEWERIRPRKKKKRK
jgi:preprotein translocase SecF subunit